MLGPTHAFSPLVRWIAACLPLAWAAAAPAQIPPWALARDTHLASDLVFPAQPTPVADANYPRMMLLKPEGDGPFPAVLLAHQCAGLVFSRANPQAANWSMLQWAKDFHQLGYVTLLVDFLGPRGASAVCQGPQGGVTLGRTTKDFFQAAAHLRALPYVNPDQVALVGFSQGAFIAFFNNSEAVRREFKVQRAFDAYVSFYPPCRIPTLGPERSLIDVVYKDMEKPQLLLLGSADTETPASECEALARPIQAAGKPLSFHTYPGQTHCWDCKSLNGFSKPGRLGTVTYTYSETTTQDSMERARAFLAQHMKLR